MTQKMAFRALGCMGLGLRAYGSLLRWRSLRRRHRRVGGLSESLRRADLQAAVGDGEEGKSLLVFLGEVRAFIRFHFGFTRLLRPIAGRPRAFLQVLLGNTGDSEEAEEEEVEKELEKEEEEGFRFAPLHLGANLHCGITGGGG